MDAGRDSGAASARAQYGARLVRCRASGPLLASSFRSIGYSKVAAASSLASAASFIHRELNEFILPCEAVPEQRAPDAPSRRSSTALARPPRHAAGGAAPRSISRDRPRPRRESSQAFS